MVHAMAIGNGFPNNLLHSALILMAGIDKLPITMATIFIMGIKSTAGNMTMA